jgi:hypothetical protein
MNSHWQRQRQPEDVPTPVAVAVSDFCRRAKAPATPSEVREALALLSEGDDFRVRALTDDEPETTPLGPFAVVDLLKGTAPSLAATRQECGYYQVVQELARVREEKAPPAPAPAPAPTQASAPPAPVPARPERAAKSPRETVQERIAPRKRYSLEASDTENETETAPLPLGGTSSFLKRDLPKPRGRFTRLDAPKTSYQELLRAEAKAVVEVGLENHEHRFSLLHTLAGQFSGTRGDLSLSELESALRHHELLDALAVRERQAVLASYTEHRGAAGRVAWALGISPSELKLLMSKLGISEEVEEVRERFRREALTSRHLTQRLDLLGREKYLMDLGIKKRFTDMLRRELETLAHEELAEARDLPGLAERLGRKHGAPSELVLRALERLGVAEGLRKRPSDGSSPPTV